MASRVPHSANSTSPRGRLKSAAANGLLLVVSAACALLVAEVAFRVAEPKSPAGTTYGRAVRKNAYGFRDRDFAIPKPPDVFRILVLGDSFTWGIGLDIEETIPKRLEAALNAASGGRAVEVVNASIPGTNTVDQLLLLQDRAWSYDPDLVLLVYNLNDIDFKPGLARKAYDEDRVVPVVQIDPGDDVTVWSKSRGLRGLILELEYRSALVRFLVPRAGQLLHRAGLLNSVEFSWVAKVFEGYRDDNPGWMESKRALWAIAALCHERRIPIVLGIYPLLVRLDDYRGRAAHQTVLQYATSIGVAEVIDLLPVFEGKNGRSFWINYADGHPNAEAHQLVTDALLPAARRHVLARLARAR